MIECCWHLALHWNLLYNLSNGCPFPQLHNSTMLIIQKLDLLQLFTPLLLPLQHVYYWDTRAKIILTFVKLFCYYKYPNIDFILSSFTLELYITSSLSRRMSLCGIKNREFPVMWRTVVKRKWIKKALLPEWQQHVMEFSSV